MITESDQLYEVGAGVVVTIARSIIYFQCAGESRRWEVRSLR